VGVVAHAYTAQRGAEHGVVDGDDGLQADLGIVAEHHLLMTGGGECFEQHGRAPLRVAHGFRPARRPSGDATNKKATLAGRRGERRGAILTPARKWPCEDGTRGRVARSNGRAILPAWTSRLPPPARAPARAACCWAAPASWPERSAWRA